MAAPCEVFVDANVLVRLITGYQPAHQQQAKRLFLAVERGERTITAPDTVIFEVVYVLASKRLYNLSRSDIQQVLAPILSLSHFRLPGKPVIVRALDLYASSNLPFGDAFIVAAMLEQGASEIYSFDEHHLDHLPQITRRAPGT
jgi:predicted nucleic acid-binding protein